MTLPDDIITSCRLYGQVTARQIAEDYGYTITVATWALLKLYKRGVLDRRLLYTLDRDSHFIYLYWLAEDPEGIN